MKRLTGLIALGCVLAAAGVVAAEGAPKGIPGRTAADKEFPPSALFDKLGTEPDVIYLIANSSLVFGPDPHGRSEEITFVGPVTVPKWPMKGYGRRILPDGRQQIDIELTQSELTGESYVLHGPVVLGEHPDLRSLGTITERTRAEYTMASDTTASETHRNDPAAESEINSEDKNNEHAEPNQKRESKHDGNNTQATKGTSGDTASASPASEEVPADFVVERKVLMTTAKGILYNETAVPVRGRVDSIPPIKFEATPNGVDVFRGMELPIALLGRDGNVNGWFYSKAHMAYAVLPAGIERSFITGTVQLRSGDSIENVKVSGPAEIHHLTAPGSEKKTEMQVVMLALRGRSDLLGGDIMFAQTFSDHDHFSRGKLTWLGNNADSKLDLFVDLYTPSAKLTTHEPLRVTGQFADCKVNGHLVKGRLNLPLVGGNGNFTSNEPRILYDEAERPAVQVIKAQLSIAERN